MTRAAHFEGFRSLILPPLESFDSDVPLNGDGTIRRSSYVIVHDLGADDPPDDERYTAPQTAASRVTYRYVTKSVGLTPFAAREVDDKVAANVVGGTVAVAGRVCDPIVRDEVGDVKQDTDTSPPLYFIESDYLLTSSPA